MKIRYDRRILLLTLAAGLPGTAAAFGLLWIDGYSSQTTLTLGLVIAAAWGMKIGRAHV